MRSTRTSNETFPVLCQAGFFFFRHGQVVESECVESRGILFCTNGRGQVQVNGQYFDVNPGTVLSLPWSRHVRHHADRKLPMAIVMCHVVPGHRSDLPVTFSVAHESEHAMHRHPGRNDGEWAGERMVRAKAFAVEKHSPLALTATLCARWYQRRQWQEDEAQWLAQLLGREVQHATEKQAALIPDAPPAIGRMLNFIEQNFNRPMRIAELIDLMGRSESHVTKIFRHYVGVSPKQYLQEKRMARAKELLHVSNLSISEVGSAVGFPNAYYFSRGFRQAVGTSPSDYRRTHHSV